MSPITSHGFKAAAANALADGKFRNEERKLLRELKGEANEVSREFEVLFEQGIKQPQEPDTRGSGRSHLLR